MRCIQILLPNQTLQREEGGGLKERPLLNISQSKRKVSTYSSSLLPLDNCCTWSVERRLYDRLRYINLSIPRNKSCSICDISSRSNTRLSTSESDHPDPVTT